MVKTRLAEVLRLRKGRYVDAWTESVCQASSRYRERPADEVRENLSVLVESILTLLEKGDKSPLEKRIDWVTAMRADLGFGLEDTAVVIFAGIKEGIAVLKEECEAEGHPADCFPLANELMEAFSVVTVLHAKAFEDIRRKEYAARTVSDLAKTCESMDEESILEKAVRSIGESFQVNVAITVLREEEDLFSAQADDDADIEDELGLACESAVQRGEIVSYERAGTSKRVTAIPIVSRGGIIGAISIAPATDDALSQHDLKMIESIAEHIGVACENSRLYMGASNAAEKLAAERSQLFTILSGLEAHVYVSDMETYDIMAVNRKMEEVYGSNLVGRKCYEALQSGMEGPCSFCTNDRLLRDGRPTGPVVWKFKNTVTGRWYNCIDSAVLWPSGKYVRLEAAFDVTDAEEARIEAENVKNLLELYNDILLHDLGNFASTSLGYLQIALEGAALAGEERKAIQTAHGQVAKCRDLINKVSEFSQVLTMVDDAREVVDLEALVDETVNDIETMQAGSMPPVTKTYDSAGRRVKVGSFAKDIFINILVNAVKYGEGKEIEVRIEDDSIGMAPAWRVSVLDQGPGIPPKQKERLFKRYSRLEGSRGTKGMGIGLSLAKTIADRYGGELRVGDRVPGDHAKGACFSVVLPKA
ncbi:TPA: hypothetical protein HA259_08915 [Thermoplasmata archaeon]|nr:hypothetical protein [Thermoplasmata archaeon]